MIKVLGDVTGLRKEDMRYLQGEMDKDEDSCVASPSGNQNKKKLPIDLASVRRAYSALFKLSNWIFENALVNALETLAGQLQINFLRRTEKYTDEDIVNVLLIVFEIPALGKKVYIICSLFNSNKVTELLHDAQYLYTSW